MIMVKPKQYQKNLCFLGRLLSPPLYWYIFHQVSTKRGRSIFYHKSLWTQSHVYAGQHTCAHTKQLNCLSAELECYKSRLSISALRWKRSYSESKKTLNCLSKERKAYEKSWVFFFYQRDGNTKDTFCRSTLRHLFSYYLVYFPIISENLMLNSSIIGRC